MLLTTGRKEKLSASKDSEIEVSSHEYDFGTGNVWYSAILEENLAKSKRKKLIVRHLDPLLKEDYSPPLIKTTFHRLIRPVPPPDPFPDVDFEVGDVVDAAHKGGWWSGLVIQVLGNRRYLVYLRFDPDVIEFDQKDLRPHLVWKGEEWFRCEKQELIESDFSAGKTVEVRTEVDHLDNIWAPAIAINANEDDTFLVKYKKSLKAEKNESPKISVPCFKIRPSPPPCGLRTYKLMENVEALLEYGWCPGKISKIQTGKRYGVILGANMESKEFDHSQLRPLMEWRDGVWQSEGKVLNSKESPHAPEATTVSTRIRVTVRTRSSAGGDAAEAAKVSVIKSGTPLSETAAQSGSNDKNQVMNVNTPVTSQPGIVSKSHPSLVLGVAASSLKKIAIKTQGKTSPKKKLQAMKNQKGSANDSVGEKAPEETKNRESLNKRKRGQPRKFVSTEPKQKTGVASNGPKAATIEHTDMSYDNQPLAAWIHGVNSPSGQSVPGTPPVEKHVDVVETPPVRDLTMVLPFAKKSPLWKVLESMESLQAVPQRPHFSPLLESEEEFREGNAIGAMVMFTNLLDKLKNIQVEDPISSINRISECFLKLEKHGFNVSAPQTRIDKLLTIKESQTWTLDELKSVEKEITERDNKRRKCEEEIEELSRKILELKEVKVTTEKEIARMQSHAAVLDQVVQNAEHQFRETVDAPWN